MAFYVKIEKAGVDLYPRLFQAMERHDIFQHNAVRFELMKRLGYFPTESSEHHAEYNAHFIPRGEAVVRQFHVPLDEYLRRCDAIIEQFSRLKIEADSDEPIHIHRSPEYGCTIIRSMVSGKPSVVYGNMPNRGAISNLPEDAIVEVPTLVDRNGPQLTTVGELPPQLIGYIQPHTIQHELFIRAATEGRRDHIYQAAMFDPLTSSMLSLDQIVQMCDELIAAHGEMLPKLDKKTLVPTSGKTFAPVEIETCRESWNDVKRQKN
jgi:alpha-galactosidase